MLVDLLSPFVKCVATAWCFLFHPSTRKDFVAGKFNFCGICHRGWW